jgi:hypothetical protein
MEKQAYRVCATGYFMGTHYSEGDRIMLYPRQAKYALMSGQLEAIVMSQAEQDDAHEKAMQRATPAAPVRKPFSAPFGERSTRRTVGGSLGGDSKR